jgi:3-oxoacyl-[acyl-carrier protein] reductase
VKSSNTLEGKVAIVTGAGRGIGRAIAETLGERGATVVVNFAHDQAAANNVVKAIKDRGSDAIALQAKLDGPQPVELLFSTTLKTFGQIDILVNNAGIGLFGPVTSVTEEAFDALFAVNVKAVFFAMQQAAIHMADGGRIINISAAMTAVGYDNTMMYAGSKGAIEQFSLAAAKELGKRGIVVNTVSPGATDTELYHSLSTPEGRSVAAQRSPFKRIAEPRDIADVVAFLAGPDARWLSGQNLRVNGAALW